MASPFCIQNGAAAQPIGLALGNRGVDDGPSSHCIISPLADAVTPLFLRHDRHYRLFIRLPVSHHRPGVSSRYGRLRVARPPRETSYAARAPWKSGRRAGRGVFDDDSRIGLFHPAFRATIGIKARLHSYVKLSRPRHHDGGASAFAMISLAG